MVVNQNDYNTIAAEGAFINAPVSVGELLDKITILEIKSKRIADPNKLANVEKELSILVATVDKFVRMDGNVISLVDDLRNVNNSLWDIEDSIRECEARHDFGEKFIDLARSVYFTNDKRAMIKKRINELTGSALVEEKSYASTSDPS